MERYFLIYISSVALAVVLTPLVIWFARRFNVVDLPDIRKVHKQPTPRIGGVAIYLPTIIVLSAVFFTDNSIKRQAGDIHSKIFVLFAVITLIFLVGLADDIRGIRARNKLLFQVAASIIVCAMGFRIKSFAYSDNLIIDFGILSWPITILWIVGITNAVNLIDGLDGLAAGLSGVACGVMLVLSIYFHQTAMAVIMLSLLGALSGFLYYNFNPAKIFMGDCGSLLLGFTIASSSVIFATKSHAIVSLTLPVLALGIPIFDTLLSILRRFLDRRSLFSPDHEHFHHKLLALGLKQRHIVISAYVITMAASGFGMLMIITRSLDSIIIFAGILILLGLAFRIVGVVKIRELLIDVKRKYNITNLIRAETQGFEKARLYFVSAKSFEQWWKSVCIAAEKMDFAEISLPLTQRNGEKQLLKWGNETTGNKYMMQMAIPIRDRRSDSMLELRVRIKTNGSLESAGRRVGLFNRLIDEYGIAEIGQKAKVLSV
jgi:UDP-GlcNAc:undecaprenyl-phosphate GlcNAc-1-phosphate transferase